MILLRLASRKQTEAGDANDGRGKLPREKMTSIALNANLTTIGLDQNSTPC